MKVIKNENIICIDVDDTLVVYNKPAHHNKGDFVTIKTCAGHNVHVWRHNSHIKFLKTQKARGRLVIVWSHGGFNWAKEVVEALDLVDYVDYIMTKPLLLVDDQKTVETAVASIMYLNREKYLGD